MVIAACVPSSVMASICNGRRPGQAGRATAESPGMTRWSRCGFLAEDGLTLGDEPVDIWRLPTREEVIRCLTRRDQNAGGDWDARTEQATFQVRPDKESPIWDPHASLIYLWTSESMDNDRAWIVVYHGGVFSKRKRTGSPSLGFRAVKDVEPSESRPE